MPAWLLPDALIGDVRLTATGAGDQDVFLGLAATEDVRAYLAGVGHATVVDVETSGPSAGEPVYRDTPGGEPATQPAAGDIWARLFEGLVAGHRRGLQLRPGSRGTTPTMRWVLTETR